MLTDKQKQFRSRSCELARQFAPTFGIDWRLMAAAAILESGWGESDLARHANNFFGIRATKVNPDAEVYLLDSPSGPQRFRRFADMDAAFRAYGRLLGTSRYYEKARRESADTALRTFLRFMSPVYCPDDPDYAAKITQIISLIE